MKLDPRRRCHGPTEPELTDLVGAAAEISSPQDGYHDRSDKGDCQRDCPEW